MPDVTSQIDRIVDAVRRESGRTRAGGVAWKAARRAISRPPAPAKAGTAMPVTQEARFDVSCLMKFFLSVTAVKLADAGQARPASPD